MYLEVRTTSRTITDDLHVKVITFGQLDMIGVAISLLYLGKAVNEEDD